ncbi:non-canonical purine NTP diphosphatase [Sungkyunkwania multivorans]|uniref:dITP/XTP pyrophosphatase n=1 Tax=Sungkyunkwania multivorans TaxID=1173618 RepID=A0ABW3CY22_9FLAO
MKLVFATNNPNKLLEVKQLLPSSIEILSLEDIGCTEDIPETANTIEGNAILKANYITEKYGHDCFADDTGLMVDALDGAPGVYSARYAGQPRNADANMDKLLSELEGMDDRKAHFKTVIALNRGKDTILFTGIAEGNIIKEKRGDHGFGYDPIFLPSGYEQTFAELSMEEKNKIAHRGKAVRKLINHLLS